MGRRWGLALVAGLTVGSTAPPSAALTIAGGPAERMVRALEQALESGDAARLRPLMPVGGPAAGWVASRWRTRLAPGESRDWGVVFEPFYQDGTAMGGLLQLTHEAPGQPTERATFGVEAWARAQGWVIGDPLPLTRPEAVVDRETLHLDLRDPAVVRGETLMALRRTGPERRLFLALEPAARLLGATEAGKPLVARQVGAWVYVGLPAHGAAVDLALRWEGAAPVAAQGRRLRRWRAEDAWRPRLLGGRGHDVTVVAMAPAGWAVVAPGMAGEATRFSDGWLYRYEGAQDRDGLPLWLADWPNRSHSDGQPRIEAWTGSDLAGDADRVVQDAGAAADQLGAVLGGYPLERLAFGEGVESDRAGRSGMWLLEPDGFRSDPQRGWQVTRAVAAAAVLARPAVGAPGELAWLQAALPDYLAAVVAGRRDGPAGLRGPLLDAYRRYDALAGQPGDRPILEAEPGAPEEDWRRLTQDKGMLVWHMLARTVGKDAFAAALRSLLGPGATRPLRVSEVQRAFEKASARPLGPFFRQWLGRLGRPRLALRGLAVSQRGSGWEVRGRLLQEGDPFTLEVPIVMATEGVPRLYVLSMSEAEVAFVLKSPHRPTSLRIDPLHDTLAASEGAVPFAR